LLKQKHPVSNRGRRLTEAEMCSLLPYVHVTGGSGTTSHLSGIGKGVPLAPVNLTISTKQL